MYKQWRETTVLGPQRKTPFPGAAHHLPAQEAPRRAAAGSTEPAQPLECHQSSSGTGAVSQLCPVHMAAASAGCSCPLGNPGAPARTGDRYLMVSRGRDNPGVKHTAVKGHPICSSGCLLSARRDQEICLAVFSLLLFSIIRLGAFASPFFPAVLLSGVEKLKKIWLQGYIWSSGQWADAGEGKAFVTFSLRPSGKQQLCAASGTIITWRCRCQRRLAGSWTWAGLGWAGCIHPWGRATETRSHRFSVLMNNRFAGSKHSVQKFSGSTNCNKLSFL